MDDLPFFSVIIPTYNRGERLRRALTHLVSQTHENFEVIVCDDGSTDDTCRVVDSFRGILNITYLWEENWGGPARPRNRGIRAASGQWICFLDSDDWWYPNKLEICFDEIKRSNPDVVYHTLDIATPKGNSFLKAYTRKLNSPVFVDLMINGNAIVNSGVCVRRALLDRTHGLSEDKDLIAREDYELWLKLSRVTDSFQHLPVSLGVYWQEDSNISKKVFDKSYAGLVKVYQKYGRLLKKKDKLEAKRQLFYAIGRVKQHQGEFGLSRLLYLESVKSRNLQIKIKSFVFMLLVLIKCDQI